MKLLFRKRKDASVWGFAKLFEGYLLYRDVFIGEERRDWEISYNDFHGFYDVSLFNIPGNYGDPSGHIQKAIDVLRGDGLEVEVSRTWRWAGKTRVDGKRLWIRVKGAK